MLVAVCGGVVWGYAANARAVAPPACCWKVDDVRAGMRGCGRTVLRGTRVERFDCEVLGVLKNTSPGRDLILCRLSGLELEKTGVIAGMSGSPVYVEGRLLGAIAYAWTFGKEPIAGITPFSQMRCYSEAHERRDLANRQGPTRVGLHRPLVIGGSTFDFASVEPHFGGPVAASADTLRMVPLQTPVVASGFTDHSLGLLRQRCDGHGLLPVQGGGVSAQVAELEKDVPLEPGGPLAVALIRGDFDLSGIGTVTHVEGKRVYGWGHPFLGLGACEYPLMTGYIHTIYPRQTVSFKMGSPLRTVGAVTADVSTGIAGWLDRPAEMLPVRMTVRRMPSEEPKTFSVEVVRQRSLLATLVYTALTNSVDMEGDLPEEMTAELSALVEIEGRRPLKICDTFSGPSYSGGRAPQALYSPVANVLQTLAYNPYGPVRVNRVECETRIQAGRRTAEIEAVELSSDVYAPGETVRATAFVRPYKGPRQQVVVSLPLPDDLPDGVYTATVSDESAAVRAQLRDNPALGSPQSLDNVCEALAVQTAARRTRLALRMPVAASGVVLDGTPLPNLPASMVQILGTGRRSGAQAMGAALVARQPTEWVLLGSESVRVVVAKNRRALPR
jgi:hypothetical protein